uniref:Glycine betaine/proline transport system substrate-binding protein n=1 Tax=Candidatus Kentrum sp. TUN TaxID=2126343 RepID=A0A451AJZ9_9GAMM|nr:MAG: glycine betaine/proline transport system substrate-binding protein [Candidatus Kentron sp. TUN]VFK60974.1 MAG: glycine betaine/proline transport system substrate-binding protein [Candidatus Kentron sp. TUN]VFK66368.1 MAG: glycine betaine/proline transport system substrate-binding protein [Candidatus Kentron sp. TUN]
MHIKQLSRLFIGVILVFGLSAVAAAKDTVRIGWTAWSDAEFVTKLAKRVLEEKMDMKVELLQTDIAPQYQGIKSGDIDIMLMSWQPNTHGDYVKKTGHNAINLGLIYTHARLGWAVPNYVPKKIKSIADLKDEEAKDALKGTITGIDPGAGLTRLSKKAIKDYGLSYELQISSGAGMTAALDRAIKRKQWIVVTSWSPHWMFGKYDLRYLDDPKGVLGNYERVHAFARKGFYQDNVKAAAFFSRMQLPIGDLEKAMSDAKENSYEKAVTNYIENHGQRIRYWLTGEIQ